MTKTRLAPLPVDRDAFVRSMRQLANSVSVVTTDGPAGRHGATVSAFCSVSADPPMVLVCLKTATRIARLVAGNGVFNLNVLGNGMSREADRFAGLEDEHVADRFSGIACLEDDNEHQLPALAGAVVLTCRTAQSSSAGSHTVYIAHVEKISGEILAPLTIHNGAYHGVVPHSSIHC